MCEEKKFKKKKINNNIENMKWEVCPICNCVSSNIRFDLNIFKTRAKCTRCINFKVCVTLSPENLYKQYFTIYTINKDEVLWKIEDLGPKYVYYIKDYIIICVMKVKLNNIWTLKILHNDFVGDKCIIKWTEEKDYDIEKFLLLLK